MIAFRSLLLFLLLSVGGGALAAEPQPIVWRIASQTGQVFVSPQKNCADANLTLYGLEFGFPTTYRCTGNDGYPVYSTVQLWPTCPTGYIVDFQKQVCMPTATAGDQILGMPLVDAKSIAWMILGVWITALCCRMLIQSLISTSHKESEYS